LSRFNLLAGGYGMGTTWRILLAPSTISLAGVPIVRWSRWAHESTSSVL